jgi:hypothetical protein
MVMQLEVRLQDHLQDCSEGCRQGEFVTDKLLLETLSVVQLTPFATKRYQLLD